MQYDDNKSIARNNWFIAVYIAISNSSLYFDLQTILSGGQDRVRNQNLFLNQTLTVTISPITF